MSKNTQSLTQILDERQTLSGSVFLTTHELFSLGYVGSGRALSLTQ